MWADMDQASSVFNTDVEAYEVFDTPATTSSIIYQVYWNHWFQNGGTMYINRAFTQASYSGIGLITGSSYFEVREMAPEKPAQTPPASWEPPIARSGVVVQEVAAFTSSLASFINIDGQFISMTITPKSISSRIKFATYIQWGAANAGLGGGFSIRRSLDNGATWTAVSKGSYKGIFCDLNQGAGDPGNTFIMVHFGYDTPNTLSEVTYQVWWNQLNKAVATTTINRNRAFDITVYTVSDANPAASIEVFGTTSLILTEVTTLPLTVNPYTQVFLLRVFSCKRNI